MLADSNLNRNINNNKIRIEILQVRNLNSTTGATLAQMESLTRLNKYNLRAFAVDITDIGCVFTPCSEQEERFHLHQ
jgi:hypothetical protein